MADEVARICPDCKGKGGYQESACGEGMCCIAGVRCEKCLGTGLHPDDIAAELLRLCVKLNRADAFKRSVDEALNSGDGSYRP